MLCFMHSIFGETLMISIKPELTGRTKLVILALTVLLACLSPAQALTPAGIAIEPGSTCGRAEITLYTAGEGLVTESYRVSSLDGSIALDGAQTAAAGGAAGTLRRSLVFPAAAGQTLIGVSFRLGGASLEEASTSQLFAIYECSSGRQIAACTGILGECPESIAEYFPDARLDQASFTGDFDRIGSRGAHGRTIYLENAGFQPLSLSAARIEGRDAAEFSLSELTTYPIEHGSYGYVYVSVRANKPGEKLANLIISSNDVSTPELSIPIRALVVRRPYLTVRLGDLRQRIISGKDAFIGGVTVRNIGLAAAPAGTRVDIIERPGTDSDNSRPKLLLSARLPRIERGGKVTLRFESRGHTFSSSDNVKRVEAKLLGNGRVIGRGSADSSVSYFYPDPKLSVEGVED